MDAISFCFREDDVACRLNNAASAPGLGENLEFHLQWYWLSILQGMMLLLPLLEAIDSVRIWLDKLNLIRFACVSTLVCWLASMSHGLFVPMLLQLRLGQKLDAFPVLCINCSVLMMFGVQPTTRDVWCAAYQSTVGSDHGSIQHPWVLEVIFFLPDWQKGKHLSISQHGLFSKRRYPRFG